MALKESACSARTAGVVVVVVVVAAAGAAAGGGGGDAAAAAVVGGGDPRLRSSWIHRHAGGALLFLREGRCGDAVSDWMSLMMNELRKAETPVSGRAKPRNDG